MTKPKRTYRDSQGAVVIVPPKSEPKQKRDDSKKEVKHG